MGNCKCVMTKKTLLQCLTSSQSKIKGVQVDRGVHYNNKGAL